MTRKTILTAALSAIMWAAGVATAAEIRLGAAEALTGNAAQYGVPIRRGFELALSEINAAGGIQGRKLRLIVEDEQGRRLLQLLGMPFSKKGA